LKSIRRPRPIKPRSVSPRRMNPGHLRLMSVAYPPHERPRTRADCCHGPRPCPYVGCVYHLYLDVTPAGSITYNFPDLEPHELEQTCALDVADGGGISRERVGALVNLTWARIQQIEVEVLAHMAEVKELSA